MSTAACDIRLTVLPGAVKHRYCPMEKTFESCLAQHDAYKALKDLRTTPGDYFVIWSLSEKQYLKNTSSCKSLHFTVSK